MYCQCDVCAKCPELCSYVYEGKLNMCRHFARRALTAAEENCFMRGPYRKEEI